MVELINENFLEVIGNKLVIEYFNQQNKLNQSFGISGFSGTFKVVEEIEYIKKCGAITFIN